MKKLISLLLVAGMLLSLAACGGTNTADPSSSGSESSASGSSSEAAGDDPILTGEKPELKVLSMYQAYDYEEQPAWKITEELTGYKTKWYALPADNADQKLLLEVSSGADYDVLLRISPNQYAQLSKQNALIDLSGLLDQYGENIKNAVSDLAWKSVTNDAGIINGMPHENMVASLDNTYGMLTGGIGVRSDMLEELGMELPTNLEDFTAFLEAAKEKYGIAPDADTQPSHYIMKGANFVTCISQNSKNPEHVVNWLNILTEPDNFRRTYIGEEGVSYEMIDGNYYPIFEGDDATNFNAYTNSDKLSGFSDPLLAFQMWQARARKTPEMAEAYEAMNARVEEYEPLISIEAYGKTSPQVQEYITALNQAFSDSFLKAVVEGTDPDEAVAAMQADWDANGGLEVEAAMQEFYDANKDFAG